jgi:hypothetical protein
MPVTLHMCTGFDTGASGEPGGVRTALEAETGRKHFRGGLDGRENSSDQEPRSGGRNIDAEQA